MERQLIEDYEKSMEAALANLSAENLPRAIELASLPEQIRGFGHIKDANVEQVRKRWRALDEMLSGGGRAAAPAPVKAA
jgi:indolepyruvate ferredoxin oxidoreductase